MRARPCAKRFDPCYEMIHRVIRLSGVIRQTINAPPFRAFQGMKWHHACFCPRERRGNPPSVALSKCSENSAAAPTVPLVLLYYALLRPAGAPTYYLVTIRSRMNCTTLSRMPLIEILHAVQSARWFRDPLKGLIDGTPSSLPGLYPDEQCCPKELLFDWENAWHS